MAVPQHRLTVEITGSAADGGYPRLSDFVKQLDAIKAGLKHTERLLSGTEERSVYYRIVELRMASPATVVLEEIPIRIDERKRKQPPVFIARKFVSTLRQIDTRGQLPQQADLAALEAYRNVGTLLHKHIEQVTIRTANQTISIGENFNQKIDKIIGPDEVVEGSITGVLLAINLHNTLRFEIYPAVGPARVACDFPPPLKPLVVNGIDQNVRVIGKLRYKTWAPYPHAITAEDLEIFPPEEKLPTVLDLRGIANTSDGPEQTTNGLD